MRLTTPGASTQKSAGPCPLKLCLRSRSGRSLSLSCTCRADVNTLSLFSPSKVNIFLRVVRKRDDGFHDLASLFHVINFGDDMHFKLLSNARSDKLTCNAPQVPIDKSNLVIKALDLFRDKTGINEFFEVRLQKQVPAGAGLGGGSANAATTLWAANEMTGRPASNADLLRWAGAIGSDISVFFSSGAAYCTGRGEIVENIEPSPLPLDTPLLLVKPPIGCSTPQIFRALRLERRSKADPLDLLDQLRSNHRVAQDLCVNDLEQPAFDTLKDLRILKHHLQSESNEKFSAVFMSGSGSTIVCAGSDAVPAFLKEQKFRDTLVSPARLIVREAGQWYERSSAVQPAIAAA